MSEREKNRYCSQGLREKLREARRHNVTIVVAPSGYGKTVAVRQMESEIPEGKFVWFSAQWDDLQSDWESFCGRIAVFDPVSSAKLLKLCSGGQIKARQASPVLFDLNPRDHGEVYLVIDDFNAMLDRLEPCLMTALLNHRCAGLHLVLIGYPFQMSVSIKYDPLAIHWISTEDLLLSQQDIKDYYLQAGCVLSDAEAAVIYENTQGWQTAVSVYLKTTLETGSLTAQPRTDKILAQIFFDRLDSEKKRLLMCLSILEALTEADICALTAPKESCGPEIDFLRQVPLMRYDIGERVFYPHAILRAFLLARLRSSQEADRQAVYRCMGHRFLEKKRLPEALGCFYALLDYDAILAQDLKLLAFSKTGDVTFEELARDIVDNCPLSVKRAHPISFLRIAYALNGAGDFSGYSYALKQAAEFMTPEETPELYGEWLIVSMLQYVPQLDKMHQVILEAEKYLKAPPRAIAPEDPFLYGCPSMWYVFYSAPGQADHIAYQLETWLADYQRVMSSRGSGADMLYRAEVASMRCRYDASNALAHTAAALGEAAHQPTVVYGVAMLMARNAIAMYDYQGIIDALEYLEISSQRFPHLQGTAVNRCMVITVRSMILSMMREVGMDNELTQMCFNTVSGDSILTQMTLHVRVMEMVMKGQTERALGTMEAILHQGPQLCNVVTRYTVSIALAAYCSLINRRSEALRYIAQALEIAYEDSLTAMFVHHLDLLRPLLDMQDLDKYRAFINEIYRQKRIKTVKDIDRTDIEPKALPNSLTTREKEVAMLASQGLRNPEIASQLYISESTVKKHMLTIFNKLNIDRRSRLIEMLNM